MVLRILYVVILVSGAAAMAQNLPAKPDPKVPEAYKPSKPLPPDFDTRNPRAPRVLPTPNNQWPEDGRLPGPGEDPPSSSDQTGM